MDGIAVTETSIKTKAQLNALLKSEREAYIPAERYRKHQFRHSKPYAIYRALHAFRLFEFCCHQRDTAKNGLVRRFYSLKALFLAV